MNNEVKEEIVLLQGKILVAPLDWGLGHATRCIPLVKKLLENGSEVLLGGFGPSLALISSEFPELETIELPGYQVSYPENGNMIAGMATQLPRLLSVINREQKIIKKIIKERRLDGLISDNRYGVYSKNISSIYVGHQLHIKMPKGYNWMEGVVNKIHRRFLENFSEIWIPDVEGVESLAGDLTVLESPPVPYRYIGWLTRFESEESTAPLRDICVLISGPEPQRSLLESLLTEILLPLPYSVTLLQGKPTTACHKQLRKDFEVINHLPANELQKVIASSRLIISRPGYSTLMDLSSIRKKAVFIPTPGQTEQEYLADRIRHRAGYQSINQKNLRGTLLVELEKLFSEYSSPPFGLH